MADVDIGEELLKAVRADFRKELGNKDSRLAKILKRIQDGKGTMHDAAMFSKECGAALSEAIAKNVTPDKLPDGQLYYNIADTILRSTLKDNYDLVNMAAQAVQEQTDNKLNIHLAPQQAAFPEDRVHKIVNAAADQTADSNTIKRRLDSPVRNVTESFYDDFVEENAGFRDEAGLKTYLVRQTNGKCCDWCAGFAGRYIYEDAPEEVFAKHDNCTCTVEYITDKYRENVHTKKRYALTPEQRQEILKNAPKPTRFTKEQAKNLQNNILNGVANSANGGIIKLEDIQIFRTLSARAKNYDVLDPQTGEYFKFVEGTRIQNAQVFAGKGCKKPLNDEVAKGLSEQIGGTPERWQHAKGDGVINYFGEERKAEVHWFQEETVGKHKFKVKRWLDDED